MSQQVTITGNLTADPEDVVKAKSPMASFSIAETSRRQVEGEWTDGNTSFYRVRCFNGLSRNVLESLHKGDRVTVVGKLEIVRREGETKDGTQTVFTDASVLADEVAVSLRFGKSEFTKTSGASAKSESEYLEG